ncbi:MAG: type II secretion system protein [Gammaproteobacteria bacterium]|nr:type II secretion system protein [Gammaproteobacteria bacterium]
MSTKARQTGMTLVELVISIVVLSIAVVGVLSVLGKMVGRSADPMIREQSIAIAEAYLEEISQSQFEVVASCPSVPGGGGRADYSHICHFHGLSDTGAVNQYGTSINELDNYDVTVTVSNSSNLGGLASAVVLRIDVNVTGPTNETFTLSGYRANY